jgi:predicted nucleic acid-binding protein
MRQAATLCGLAVIGTLGLLEQAAARGSIDLPQTLERLQRTNARVDPKLVEAPFSRDIQLGRDTVCSTRPGMSAA